ncbi:hypothetical protein [Falsiroseomonas sp. HW251]|uniref:hypothetical protein n=1 Tax=Falsiroseomonas sp. HW251 TaxID=3390998 RepID=UPI003D311CDC
MPRSEIADANAIVASVTHLLDLVHEAEENEVLLRIYADEDAFRLAHPDAEHLDNALHARIVRTAARAAWRIGYDITVIRLRAAPLRAWLSRQGPSGPGAEAYEGEPGDTLEDEAALRALGLNPAELKEAPRKPAQGKTLAARMARWATDPEADESLIGDLTEELLSQRLDGALGPLATMLEPEDFAYARHEIDLTASACVIGDKGKQREGLLFVSPVLREGDAPRGPELPAGLQARLTGIALDPSFVELILAPFWVPTAALARLKPSELREAAEALASGQEPVVPRAAPADRDVCLLGLTIPMVARDEQDEEEDEADGRLDAWLAVVADAAGGGRAEPPLSLARALDLLRRVKLAVPDEAGLEDEDEDDEEEEEEEDDEEAVEVDEALVEALVEHLAAIGTGSALLTGFEDGVVAIAIAGGAPDIEPEPLRRLLADALAESGLLFVSPGVKPARGHAFLLERGEAQGLSAEDAAAAFAEEAIEDWAAAPGTWVAAPPLDYDPAMQ